MQMAFEPIAIVGQACVLPGANDPQALWRLISEGGSAISQVPAGRWRIRTHEGVASDRGGYVRDFAFDPASFPEATGLDPLFHWLFHCGRVALNSAGDAFSRTATGAIVGNLSYPSPALSQFAEYTWLSQQIDPAVLGIQPVDPRNRFMSGLPAHLLARGLGLGAGAFALDAACASSLYAIKFACDALHDRRAELMLAGAVNRADDLFIHTGFTALGALSPTGRSRPFHAEADGLVPSEGAALLALCRLADAEKKGLRVLGVIRGAGLSNDGRGRGFLVPSEDGQVRALRSAYEGSGIDPADISLVECHATGTAVGDAVEIASLGQIFQGRKEPLPIGSLKANLGHLITAAGAAGLMKVLGAFRERVRPPSPGAGVPHPALRDAGLRVLQAGEPWTSEARLAGVSAFGFGGNNAHLIVEEPSSKRPAAAPSREFRAPPIAIVAMGARVGKGQSVADFAKALFEGQADPIASELALSLDGLTFPPRDLQETLPQQLLLLAAAREATRGVELPERTGVFAGMQCDAEICRHGARWRSADWSQALNVPADELRDAFVPALGAAGVIGAMPNIVANRLNRQLDLRSMSLSISAEELSGIRALELARRALEHGELDAALVCAVDLAAEPVHHAAAGGKPGDAAVVLVLKRLEDAGDHVLAVLGGAAQDPLRLGDSTLTPLFGRAHAAHGLLNVAAAALACARQQRPGGGACDGAVVEIEALGGQRASVSLASVARKIDDFAGPPLREPILRLPAHPPRPQWTPRAPRTMPPAPQLPSVFPRVARPAQRPAVQLGAVAEQHRNYLARGAQVHAHFLQTREHALQLLTNAFVQRPKLALAAREPLAFSRQELEIHAGGKISEIFGPAFSAQDEHRLQVRMPEPPLLLADRVTDLEAVPGSMATGTVWTETDVAPDAWYLNEGFMPAGIMIESGQADLFLVSYLGIDLILQGKRAYRLLGCELTYHGGLPQIGDTLRYQITIDSHARHDEVRLFFFHYDCEISGRKALTVRRGEAGFFSAGELAKSAGVTWKPEEQKINPRPRLDPPQMLTSKRAFSVEEVRKFAQRDVYGCFGEGFERGQTHVRSPAVQSGKMLLIDRVDEFNPTGGPWGRGYLRAATAIHPDDWFFQGHFKNDPCMPGTLMFEGCLQAMSFYLAALGYTLQRDGWRFEPVPEVPYQLQCRGQVLPSSKELICELFVEEVHDGPHPMIFADLLGTVDGLKAFHARHVGLRLVPDWPLRGGTSTDTALCRAPDGFPFDYNSLLACAWGKPSQAFGSMYERFDGTRRVARLPGPPYHFMSRVTRIDGELGVCKAGAEIEIEYDVSKDAWYGSSLPFAVLLEAALQPCGWLASYVGSALVSENDLSFRNLDGTGTVFAEVPAGATLRTVTRLKSVSRSAGMVLETFQVRCFIGEKLIYELDTGFGFFPKSALENQVGLPVAAEQRAQLTQPSDFLVDLLKTPEPRLPGEMLLMIDRVTAFDPRGGKAGLGFLRAEKDVDAADWFFKAHFFQDPVQPGSLGVEAMLQLLRFFLIQDGTQGRFEIAAVPHTWKYRGQVVPENRLISVTMEITQRDAGGAVADASLWVDGKRIYEAKGLAVRVAGDARTALVPEARAFWSGWSGAKAPIVEELYSRLLTHFVRDVHIANRDALRKPVLFLANHQVALESTLFAVIASALTGKPVLSLAKIENANHWLELIMRQTFAHPGWRDPKMTLHFDRADPASLPGIIDELARELQQGRSVLVHVEGTRSLSCREPVRRMSGTFLDMARKVGCAIVPVRFTGGLPIEPLTEKAEFALGLGQQEIWFGEPLEPEDLARLDYAERIRTVIDAINSLGPAADEPLPGDPAFEAAVRVIQQRTGCSFSHAVFLKLLEQTPQPPTEAEAHWLAGFLKYLNKS
jgi:3-oxoacyl-(acyl-carrier-protein) synthase/3-hydroxymyristoyl/3-hydroxydecanoyl-(acyl carrier protein) dehydratase/1-acyl-sn-glycerol-3-phosphate acyltransferase